MFTPLFCSRDISTTRRAEQLMSAPADGAISGSALAELVARWHAADDQAAAAEHITRDTLSVVAGVDAIGLLLLARRRRLTSPAPTDETAAELDALQIEPRDGPGPAALLTGRPVLIDVSAGPSRWPSFVARAAERGVASIACLPLRTAEERLGTLNLYATTPDAFLDGAAHAAAIATHAALALHAVAQRESLTRALASRDRIGQAKGILMVRHDCTATHAYDLLVAASQAANIKLVDVADWLIAGQQSPQPDL